MRQLDFGLCARVPPRFFPTLSPRSFFMTGQRFPTLARGYVMSVSRHVLSCLDLSLRPLFPTGQRFPIPKHVTFSFPVTSGSGDVTSGHVTSACAHHPP